MGFITSLTIITVRTINIYWQLSENPKHYEHHSTHDISICLGYPGYVVAPRGVPASRKAEPCGLPVRSRIVTKAQACETAEGWRKWMMNVYIYMVFMLNIYIYIWIVELVTGLSQNYSTRPPDLKGLDHKVDEIGIPVQW